MGEDIIIDDEDLFELSKEKILNYKIKNEYKESYEYSEALACLERYPEGFVDHSAKVHPSVKMGQGCVIMPNVVIEAGAVLGDNVVIKGCPSLGYISVIKKECVLADGVLIEDSVVDAFSQIGKKTIIEGVKIDNSVSIGAFCTINASQIGCRAKIGDNVNLEGLSEIGSDVVMGNENYIGEWVKIKNQSSLGSHCVILEESIIKAQAQLNNAFIKKHCVVGSKSKIINSLLEEGAKIQANQEIINDKKIKPKSNFFSWGNE